jgi:hypothetical protein
VIGARQEVDTHIFRSAAIHQAPILQQWDLGTFRIGPS